MFIGVFLSIIGSLISINVINYIKNNDNECIFTINKIERGILVFLISLSTILLYSKYTLSLNFLFNYYLLIYLVITGYIDFKVKQIYCILNYITIVIGIIFFIYKSNYINMELALGSLIVFIVLNCIMTKFNSYGAGDEELFNVVAIFLCCSNDDIFPLELILINMLVSGIVLVILNIRNIKLKERVAFAPAIAISTMSLIVIL